MPANDPLGYEALSAIPVLPDPYGQPPPAPPPLDPSSLYLPPPGQPAPIPAVDPALAEVGPVGYLPASIEEQAYIEATQPGVSAAGRAQGLTPLAEQGSRVAQTALPAVQQAQVAQQRLDHQAAVIEERNRAVQEERDRRDKQQQALQTRRIESQQILDERREEVQKATKADPLAGKRKAIWANAILSWATAYFGNDKGATPADAWKRQQSLIQQAAESHARKIQAAKQGVGYAEKDLQGIADEEDEVQAMTDLIVAEENEKAAQELQAEQARSDSESHKFASGEIAKAAIQEAQARRAKALQDEEERLLKREERLASIGYKRAQTSKLRAETSKSMMPPEAVEPGKDPRAIKDPYTGTVIGQNVDRSETSLRKDREYLIKSAHNTKNMTEYIRRVNKLKRVWQGPGSSKMHDQEVADLMQLYTQLKGDVRLELFGQTSTEAQEKELEKIVVPPLGFLNAGGYEPAKVMQNYVRRSNSEMEMKLRAMGVEKTRDKKGKYLPNMPMAKAEAMMSIEGPAETAETSVLDAALDREKDYDEWIEDFASLPSTLNVDGREEQKATSLNGLKTALKAETSKKRKTVIKNTIAAIENGWGVPDPSALESEDFIRRRKKPVSKWAGKKDQRPVPVDRSRPTAGPGDPLRGPSSVQPTISPLDIDAELLRGFMGQ